MATNSERQDVAQAGQVYDTSNNLIISVENTNDTLKFGDFVVNDSGSIVKWNSDDYANKKPVGVVLYNALEIEGKPLDKSKIPLISRGTVWVSVDDTDAGFANVKKGSIAYLNAVSGEPTGFIDDVITNQKIGAFLEEASELNEGGHIAAIELKLFAKNTNNLIVIESSNDDPPLPPSGSIIYYNEPDGSLRSSSGSEYSYINPKPYASMHSTIDTLVALSPEKEIPITSLEMDATPHLFVQSGNGFQFIGSFPTLMHVTVKFYLANQENTNSNTVAFVNKNGSERVFPSEEEFYIEASTDGNPNFNYRVSKVLDFIVLMNPQDTINTFIGGAAIDVIMDGYVITAVGI